MVLLFGNQGTSAAEGTKLSIFMSMGLVLVVLLLPESSLAVAGGIVVRRAGAVTLFPLACAAEDDFQSCGDEEENAAEYESQLKQLNLIGVLTR